MSSGLANAVLAWLLTYVLHSTVLLGSAWFLTRRTSLVPQAREFIWKTALVGGVITASLQSRLDVRPAGSFAIRTVTTTAVDNATNRAPKSFDLPDVTPLAQSSAAPDAAPAASSVPTLSIRERVAQSWPRIVVLAWLVVAALLVVAWLARHLILTGRLTDRELLSDGVLVDSLATLRRGMGYRGRIRLTVANTISSPVALLRGEICVPRAALSDLSPDEQRGLLAHELAHLERHDPLWLTAVSLLERVFFFQPLNRIARRALQVDAEFLCDERAAEHTGSGRPVALCLARVAEWIELSPLGVPVAGMAEQRSLLVSRIARLVGEGSVGRRVSRLVLSGGALVFLGAIIAAAPGVHGVSVTKKLGEFGASKHKGGDKFESPTDSQSASATQGVTSTSTATHGPASNGPVGVEPSSPALGGAMTETPALGVVMTEEEKAKVPEDTAVTNALIERLKDTDASVRRAAASSLGRLKARRAVPALIAAAGDKSREVRAAVAEALQEIQDERGLPALLKLMTDESSDVRHKAIEGLEQFSHSLSASQVIGALSDSNAEVRSKAAELLGEIGDHAASGALVKLLKDPVADVRHAAVHGLEHLKDASAAPALIQALSDQDNDVRSSALSALRELRVGVSESALLQLLADPASDVRQEALQYVSERPFANALPALRKLLDDESSDVREAAVSALGDMHTPQAREVLKGALKSSDPKVRRKAAEALGERP